MTTMTNAFIGAHVDIDGTPGAYRRKACVRVHAAAGVIDAIRADYVARYGDRPVYGPAGVGRAAFAAIVDAVVAADDAQAADYAQFCADDAFAVGG